MTHGPLGTPLSDEALCRLRAFYRRHGERKTVAHFHLSRNALLRAMAGLGIYPGTHLMVAQGFAEETSTTL